MSALCPDCKGKNGKVVDRQRDEPSGLLFSFECPYCEYRWQVSL